MRDRASSPSELPRPVRWLRWLFGFLSVDAGKLSDVISSRTCLRVCVDSFMGRAARNPNNPLNPLNRRWVSSRARAPPR